MLSADLFWTLREKTDCRLSKICRAISKNSHGAAVSLADAQWPWGSVLPIWHSGSANHSSVVCVESMAFTDASLTALRVFSEVAERGTLTAAAAAMGYTQSAVSRQIAALERAAGQARR
jgi:hypothetical protein